MKRQFQAILLTSAAMMAAQGAHAQSDAASVAAPDDEIVVTAVARGQNRLHQLCDFHDHRNGANVKRAVRSTVSRASVESVRAC